MSFNPFLTNVTILYPLKTPVFSEGIKWDYWPEIGSWHPSHTDRDFEKLIDYHNRFIVNDSFIL